MLLANVQLRVLGFVGDYPSSRLQGFLELIVYQMGLRLVLTVVDASFHE